MPIQGGTIFTILVAALFSVASAATVVTIASDGVAELGGELFERFVREHNRPYDSASPEFSERRELFHRRLAQVEAFNNRPQRLWTAGINSFADRTDDELKTYRGWKHNFPHEQSEQKASFLEIEKRTFPSSFNWLNLTRAYSVPEQGSCGSCWAVTTAAVMDAHREIYSKQVQSFSAQELVSCVPNPRKCGGSGGCDGATVELGMKWIMKNGLSLTTQVPYQGKDSSCGKTTLVRTKDTSGHQSTSEGTGLGLGMTGYHTLPSNKEAPVLAALIDKGPVALSVAGGSWFSYSSGIFTDCPKDCVVDHAVTLYGIGADGSNKYYLIRNSWGPSWGERGFIRLTRTSNEDSVCGTDNTPQEGVGCVGGPPSVTVCGSCGVLYDSVVPQFNAGLAEEAQTQAEAFVEERHGTERPGLFRREQRTALDAIWGIAPQ